MGKIKDLVKLNEQHVTLVTELRKFLEIGQIGFFKAAKILATIKDNKTYLGEDLTHKWTWAEFCARPDLPIPGSTPESRRRTADWLIQIYKVFILKHGFKGKELAPIGWTKLALISGAYDREETEREAWMDKARDLSLVDLRIELKGQGYKALNCNHENEEHIWYCKTCGAKSPTPMSIKNQKKYANKKAK